MTKVCIVGSADSLIGKGLGEQIDNHDIIIRINQPQISGFEKDVGSRITHSFISPWQIVGFTPNRSICRKCHSKMENATPVEKSIIIEDCFNRLKLEDNGTIVLKDTTEGVSYDFHRFYKEISHLIDTSINFSFIQVLKSHHGVKKWRKRGFAKVPTNGTLVIEHYRKVYGNVNIAGFGHSSKARHDKFYHYWDSKKEKNLTNHPHDINTDIIWLKKLHDKHKIRILELDENNNTF